MTRKWIYGWNDPGFMPDCDPVECDTWQEARDALAWEVERWDEMPSKGQTSAVLDAAAAEIQAADSEQPFIVRCGGQVLWVELTTD